MARTELDLVQHLLATPRTDTKARLLLDVPATLEHPAQVYYIDIDVPVYMLLQHLTRQRDRLLRTQ